MTRTIAIAITAMLALTAASAEAAARPRHRATAVTTVVAQSDINAIPLTVNRRSWLDPGPVAPRGTGDKYVTANTGEFIRTPLDVQDPSGFGRDALPGQPYVPGRSFPTVEFSTTPNGRVDVANELLPQNFYFNPAAPRPPSNYQPSYTPDIPDAP